MRLMEKKSIFHLRLAIWLLFAEIIVNFLPKIGKKHSYHRTCIGTKENAEEEKSIHGSFDSSILDDVGHDAKIDQNDRYCYDYEDI